MSFETCFENFLILSQSSCCFSSAIVILRRQAVSINQTSTERLSDFGLRIRFFGFGLRGAEQRELRGILVGFSDRHEQARALDENPEFFVKVGELVLIVLVVFGWSLR